MFGREREGGRGRIFTKTLLQDRINKHDAFTTVLYFGFGKYFGAPIEVKFQNISNFLKFANK